MRTTAILNLKGGVGKTTTVIHMAHMLHRFLKARVLVVDCDAQCNLTQYFDADPKNGCTPKVLLSGDAFFAIASIQPTNLPDVDILAADDTLMELDLSQLRANTVNPYVFKELVLELGRRDKYDYVLFDCPPSFNSACAAALIAADDVIIPIKLDRFSVAGMTSILRQVQNMQKLNSRLRVAGILPTMWYKSDKIKEAEDVLRHSRLHVFPHIRRNDKVDAAAFAGELADAKNGHMQDYKAFVKQYVEGGHQHGNI